MKKWETPKLQVFEMDKIVKEVAANAKSNGGTSCGWCQSYGCNASIM